jgi:hypothetical protein
VWTLIDARDQYDRNPYYDEIFHQAHERIAATGEAGKGLIAMVAFWKRSAQGGRWITPLLSLPDSEVREHTRAAFGSTDDREALRHLANLPGFRRQEALATALLTAANPDDYGIMDRWALATLDRLGLGVGTSSGKTLRYLERIRSLRSKVRASGCLFTCRDVDKALYILRDSVTM